MRAAHAISDAPSFDEAAIRSHVALLHERATGVNGVLVVFVAFANGAGPVTHHCVGEVDGMVASIMAHATTPNANVYVGLHLMRRDLPRGERGKRADIVAMLGLVLRSRNIRAISP
jgi:hypothetical protein